MLGGALASAVSGTRAVDAPRATPTAQQQQQLAVPTNNATEFFTHEARRVHDEYGLSREQAAQELNVQAYRHQINFEPEDLEVAPDRIYGTIETK